MELPFELHWYPGHMAKARRELQDRWQLVDVVLEIVDARAPSISRHPDPFANAQRPRVLLLGKVDLADEPATRQWLAHFERTGTAAWAADLRTGGWVATVRRMLRAAARSSGKSKGLVRALVAGLPNVGKSTAINSLAGRAKAQTGGRPGVTRGLQWLGAGPGLQLLDSPGVLWPGVTRGRDALFLAATGCVPDTVFDREEAAEGLLRFMLQQFADFVYARYGDGLASDAPSLLEEVARRRSMLQAGGVPDRSRAAAAVLHDFRTGRLGRMTLELPPTMPRDGDEDESREPDPN